MIPFRVFDKKNKQVWQVISEVSVEQVMKKINAIEAQPGPVREERQEAGLIRRWRISADL